MLTVDATINWAFAGKGQSTVRSLLVLFLALLLLGHLSFAADSKPAKNVLILFSWTDRSYYPAVDLLKTTVRSHVQAPIDFYVEYLDSQRFLDAGYEKSLSDTLRLAYAGVHLDVVLAHGHPGLSFAVRHRDELFPGTPIVVWGIDPRRIEDHGPGITGITYGWYAGDTLGFALRLHPDTKNVAVIAGTSEFEQYWRRVFHDEFRHYQGKVKLIDLAGPSTDLLLKQALALPPKTIVFFHLTPQESPQPFLGRGDLLTLVSQRFPTYCVHEGFCLGGGGIGGSYPDILEQRVKAGELAARILNGEKPENIPVLHDSGARPYVDWRQLRRWNIAESALPPGTIVLYRESTLWERYKKYTPDVVGLVLLQVLLIIGLLSQRARRRKAEANLRKSEECLLSLSENVPVLVWVTDAGGKYTYLNKKWLEFTGNEFGAKLEDVYGSLIHPDDRQHFVTAISATQKHEPFKNEYRMRRQDGAYRWLLDVAVPRTHADGSFLGFIGTALDITDLRTAQQALENVSGRLIEAQEKERSRIARELHDDICQRLVLLSVELEHAIQNAEAARPAVERRTSEVARAQQIWQASQHCSDISRAVQALSHELHSSSLDYLGIVATLAGFCREFSESNQISVEFTSVAVPEFLSRDVSLCLFRIVQEGLRNAAKHSGVSVIQVDLRGAPNIIELEVRDAGVGFDPAEVKNRGGLGLLSMRERVNLVGGTISIESKLKGGTKIRVTIPLEKRKGIATA
jgi:PAS domain S-box-containing protein